MAPPGLNVAVSPSEPKATSTAHDRQDAVLAVAVGVFHRGGRMVFADSLTKAGRLMELQLIFATGPYLAHSTLELAVGG